MKTYILRNTHGREVAIVKAEKYTELERSEDGVWTHYVFLFHITGPVGAAEPVSMNFEVARIWAASIEDVTNG